MEALSHSQHPTWPTHEKQTPVKKQEKVEPLEKYGEDIASDPIAVTEWQNESLLTIAAAMMKCCTYPNIHDGVGLTDTENFLG